MQRRQEHEAPPVRQGYSRIARRHSFPWSARGLVGSGRRPVEAALGALLCGCLLGLLPRAAGADRPPGADRAEGFGATSKGGAGGETLVVRSLADSGPGTLREALAHHGPRRIEFAVEGDLELASRLRCTEGQVTIDGTTAPGKGVTLLHHGLGFVNCSDIIVRGLRIRVTTGGTSGDGILLWGKDGGAVERVVVSHCSAMGATDEVINTWGAVRDVTFQWCIVAEGRPPHSKAWLSGQGSDRISIHHCLLARCEDRNPKLEGGLYDVVNNVVCNWSNNNATKVRLGARINLVGNTYLPGPASAARKGCVFIEDPPQELKLFLADNLSPLTPEGEDPWNLVTLSEKVGGKWVERQPAPRGFQAKTRFPAPAITTQPAAQACERVLDQAGAPVRDEADQRVVSDVRKCLRESGSQGGR